MMIILRPLGRSRYAALSNGRVLVESRTPILAAARQLLREGVSEREPLAAAHEGSSTVSITTTVGVAARLAVIERDCGGIHFAPYDPDSSERLKTLQGGRQGAAFYAGMTSGVSERETAFCDDHVR